MVNFARLVDDVAVDVSATPHDHFHPDIASKFVPVPAEVRAGWIFNGDRWHAPVAPTDPLPESESIYPAVGPIHFQMLFTSEEAVAADAARGNDQVLNRFWGLIEDPRTDVVNLALQSVQDAVEYTLMVAKQTITDLDVAARKAEILSGKLQ